jgi:hypothetical protein
MILLNPIVQVLALADLDHLTGFLLERFQGGGVGAALVDRDLVRETLLPNRFLKKAQSRFLVAMGRQENVDGLSVPVDGTVQVLPLPLSRLEKIS